MKNVDSTRMVLCPFPDEKGEERSGFVLGGIRNTRMSVRKLLCHISKLPSEKKKAKDRGSKLLIRRQKNGNQGKNQNQTEGV